LGTARADQTERRLLYRCRRGTRELDCILTGFFERDYKNLDSVERQVFAEFLEVEDSLLIDWLCNGLPIHQHQFKQIVERILTITEASSTSKWK